MLNRLPTSTTTALFGGMLKCCDFVATNVPGAPVPVFTGGARIERLYAFAPTAGAAVNVSLISHCDTCCIGVVIDTTAVPDAAVLVDCLRQGFDEMLAATDRTTAARLIERADAPLSVIEPVCIVTAVVTARHRPPARAPSRATAASVPARRRCATRRSPRSPTPRHGYLGTSHRRDGVRSVVAPHPRRHRRALLAARRLRGAARQRRLDAVLGRGRVRPHRAAQLAPRARRVLVEVRRGRARPRRTSTTPRCSSPNPGAVPATLDARRGRRLRLPAQRDLDRRDRAAAPAGRRRRARRRRRHVGRGRHARRSRRRSTSTTSRRRSASRATAASGSRAARPRAIERIERIARDRALDAADARPRHRARELAARPDVQHAGARDALPARAPGRVDARQRRARVGGERGARRRPAIVYGWAEARPWATPVRQGPGATAAR